MNFPLKGRISFFGGPEDCEMRWGENLSLYWNHGQCDRYPQMFLRRHEDLCQGTARRLNPNYPYIALRFDTSKKEEFRHALFKVTNPKNNLYCICRLVDWGPAEWTGRVIDASPILAVLIGVKTDDEVMIEMIDDGKTAFL